MSGDELNLKWKSFESNLSSSLSKLRESNDFYDVTIVCENDQIQCHKLVLSACSPFFLQILRRNPHPHPLLYLKGVTFKHLLSMLDFMYNGQVNVAQEDLMSFMAIADDLKVKGLTQSFPEVEKSQEASPPVHVQRLHKEKSCNKFFTPETVENNSPSNLDKEYIFSPLKSSAVMHSPAPSTQSSSVCADMFKISDPITLPAQSGYFLPQNPYSVPNFGTILSKFKPSFPNHHNFSPSFSYLQVGQEDSFAEDEANKEEGVDPLISIKSSKLQFREKCSSMIQKMKDGSYQCLQCEYNHARKRPVRRHVEGHVPMRHACNLCNRSFKNRNSLSSHKSLKHRVTKDQEVLDIGKILQTELGGQKFDSDKVVPNVDQDGPNVTCVRNELRVGVETIRYHEEGSTGTRGELGLLAGDVVDNQEEGRNAFENNLSEIREGVRNEEIDQIEYCGD